MYYLGLDTATVTGIALYNVKHNFVGVTLNKGTPIDLYTNVLNILTQMSRLGVEQNKIAIVIEAQHFIRNAKTIRSLSERIGYVRFSLVVGGYRVVDIAPKVARRLLGTVDKQSTFQLLCSYYEGSMFSSDHADATAVALAQAKLDGYEIDISTLRIRTLII